MKTQEPRKNAENKIIRMPAAGKKPKVEKLPPLDAEAAKVIDLYIAARRMQAKGAAAAEALKARVLAIVQPRLRVARKGALVTLDHSYSYKYSSTITVMAQTLSKEKEMERDSGAALAVVSETVAFEDVRRKERERAEAAQKKAG